MIGTTVAERYHLVRLLGAGGVAEVYAARDEALGREVAVKLFRAPLPPGAGLDAAADEFHLVATLAHPGLVTMFDLGLHERRPFFVSELLDGCTLAALIASGIVPPPALRDAAAGAARTDPRTGVRGDVSAVLTLLERIALVLDAVHARGLVHRDLKPGNLMVLPGGAIKMLDFGLARVLERGGIAWEAGAGTAPYMAPEQIRGEPLDGRADLYALGCIAYELLTGQTPFAAARLGAVVVGHLTLAPPPVRVAAPRIPPALEAWVLRLLAKNPSARPASGAEAARLLAACRPQADALEATVLPPALAALQARRGEAPAAVWQPEHARLDAMLQAVREGHPARVALLGADAADILRTWRRRQRGDAVLLDLRVDGRAPDALIAACARKLAPLRSLLPEAGPEASVVELLRAVTRVRPVIICIEDFGLAHPRALREFTQACAEAGDAALGLCASLRVSSGVPWPSAREARDDLRAWCAAAEVMPARALRPDEAAALAAAQLGAPIDDAALLEELLAATGGSAGALRRALVTLREGGALLRRVRGWRRVTPDPVGDVLAAATVAAATALPAAARDALERGALLGDGAWPAELAGTVQCRDTLVTQDWWHRDDTADGATHAWCAPWAARAVRASLAAPARLALARAILADWSARDDEAPPLLEARARLLLDAGRPGDAWPLALRAARDTSATPALAEALAQCDLARTALAAWSAGDSPPAPRALDAAMLDVLRTQRRLLHAAGRPREARALAEDVLARARALHEPRDEALALNDLGVSLWRAGDPRAGLPRLAEALALWTTLDDHAARARALVNLGEIHRQLGDYRASVACDRDAIRAGLTRTADGAPASRADALRAVMHLGNTWHSRGNFAAARRCYRRAAAAWRASGHDLERARALHNLALVLAATARVPASIRAYRASLDAFEREGAPLEAALARANLAEVLLDAGDWDAGRDAAARSLAASEQAGDESLAVRARCSLLRWALAVADGAALATHLIALRGSETRAGDLEDELAIRVAVAEAWLSLGDDAAARALVTPLTGPAFLAQREAAPRLARTLVLAGSWPPRRAVALLERAAHRGRAHGDRRDLLRLGGALGQSLIAAGDVAAGCALVRRVAAHATRAGLRPLAADAALALARWDGDAPRVAAQRAAAVAAQGATADTRIEAAIHLAEVEFAAGIASLAWSASREAIALLYAAWVSLPDPALRALYRRRRLPVAERLRRIAGRAAAATAVAASGARAEADDALALLDDLLADRADPRPYPPA